MRCRLHQGTVVMGLTLLQAVAAADVRPNVVIIMTDDQGFGDLGVQGHPILETPRIDALAVDEPSIDPAAGDREYHGGRRLPRFAGHFTYFTRFPRLGRRAGEARQNLSRN